MNIYYGNYVDGGGGGGDAGIGSGLDLTMYVVPMSVSYAQIRIDRSLQTKDPDKYRVKYTKTKDINGNAVVTSNVFLDFPVTNAAEDTVLNIYNLEEGCTYIFYVRAYKGTDYGDWVYQQVQMNITRFNGKVIGSGILPEKISSPTGFLTIQGPSIKNKFAIATKTFNQITNAAYVEESVSWGYNTTQKMKKYKDTYYSFGTSLYLDASIDILNQAGGMGFFTNSEGTEGYFILIESTALAASLGRKTIRIVKLQGGKIYKLVDSQRSPNSTYEGLYGGVQYDIDVKVKVKDYTVNINVYINGFRISAIDKNEYSQTAGTNKIVDPTQNISLMCSQGNIAFDYVYGTSIKPEEYSNSDYQLNFYRGQFSNDLLNSLYGELTYVAEYGQDFYNENKKAVEEFGTTAREIVKANIRFPSRPSFPVKWGVGDNRLVQILSSKISNFGGESYVLNNSSVTVPLSDNNLASFYVIGNTLAPSGQLEYSTDEAQTYTTKEPIVFESKWLQNISDVKNLAEWIKDKVVNRGKVVTMSVFGNPLISVGDIVRINYPYHGFDGTETFIVTNINHSYSEGLETSITCRLIVS